MGCAGLQQAADWSPTAGVCANIRRIQLPAEQWVTRSLQLQAHICLRHGIFWVPQIVRQLLLRLHRSLGPLLEHEIKRLHILVLRGPSGLERSRCNINDGPHV